MNESYMDCIPAPPDFTPDYCSHEVPVVSVFGSPMLYHLLFIFSI